MKLLLALAPAVIAFSAGCHQKKFFSADTERSALVESRNSFQFSRQGLLTKEESGLHGKKIIDTPASAQHSLCDENEKPVFSCPLNDQNKIVSLCSKGENKNWRLRYMFGKLSRIEMEFPDSSNEGSSPSIFMHTYLTFAGGTGGYAYSFSNSGYKYILYSISGTHGFEDSGIVVSQENNLRSGMYMKCAAGALIENDENSSLERALIGLTRDQDLADHGLPAQRNPGPSH